MMILIITLVVVVVQRLSELAVSKRNEQWAISNGGVEHGRGHYWMFFVMHTLWLVSIPFESFTNNFEISTLWPLFISILLAAQGLRYWTIHTLGKSWNTKIIVISGQQRVKTGPFAFIDHPNYVAVAIEIVALPMVFGCWVTAIVFTLANAIVLLGVRIPAEEKALSSLR